MTNVIGTRHVLAVKDLETSAAYFMDVLGFKRDFDVDGWEFLSLGSFCVMLGECPKDVSARETNNHSYFAYIEVDDVDVLYTRYSDSGAEIISDIADKPWEMR
ncbi:MAG: VOC family protein, partial [Rubricoccaceae bacterium]|nr:VOC family protein [Rubricoccaceae bacterium]